jgi:hypothetical protein
MSLWRTAVAGAEHRVEHNRRIEVLDDRYHHDHYYVSRGTVVHELPVGY